MTPNVNSDPDPDNGMPWFDFDIDNASMSVTFAEANGLSNYPDAADNASVDHLPPNSSHPLSLSDTKPGETHVLIVALDGSLEFIPQSEEGGDYYAHLAWYYPSSDTWDIFNFVDGG